ncbi:YwqG family protein [Nocardiopsis sp. ARC36]
MGIPDDEISRFSRHLRLAIGLSGGGDGSPVGHIGGLPRLPVGMKWPSAEGIPLPLFLSVDCGALPGVDGFDLPADGTLLFFVHQEMDFGELRADPGQYARVVYVPDGTETAVAEPPDSACVSERIDVCAELRADLPLWLEEGEEDWHEFWEDLEWDDMSPFQQQLARYMERELPHLDELRSLAYDLWSSGAYLAIGGYADDETTVGSITAKTLAKGEWLTYLDEDAFRLASEWLPLANEGRTYTEYYTKFMIRHGDLAAARWDKALTVTNFEAP